MNKRTNERTHARTNASTNEGTKERTEGRTHERRNTRKNEGTHERTKARRKERTNARTKEKSRDYLIYNNQLSTKYISNECITLLSSLNPESSDPDSNPTWCHWVVLLGKKIRLCCFDHDQRLLKHHSDFNPHLAICSLLTSSALLIKKSLGTSKWLAWLLGLKTYKQTVGGRQLLCMRQWNHETIRKYFFAAFFPDGHNQNQRGVTLKKELQDRYRLRYILVINSQTTYPYNRYLTKKRKQNPL